MYHNQKYPTMPLKVLVHAKLCEQRECHPDSANKCRAEPLVSESCKEPTVHKQRDVKKYFSQILVTGILKERKYTGRLIHGPFIKIFYCSVTSTAPKSYILFGAGSIL